MSTHDEPVVGRRRLTGWRPALALIAGMLAVPLFPAFLQLGSDDDSPQSAGAPVELATESGVILTAVPPDGWDVDSVAGGVVWRSGDAFVRIEAHDLGGRDMDTVGQRLMRMDRVRGFSPAFDGGRAASGDGRLTGATCVVTSTGHSGTCAVIGDDDVVVLAQTLGAPESPALPLQDVLDAIGRNDR
ncbi:hypothetical protein ACNUDN_25530 [Mycobacterium sp. smrl_JER01]|uniref:hypothetical protein n=1 Tax=Mycobacterium sp. smrl_JER01 TaxID=3402633 RepID=UPI003AC41084